MCNCGAPYSIPGEQRKHSKEISDILNKWCFDNLGRKLLISEPIYDAYNDIVGYITRTESGNIVRIFSKNIQEIID